MSDKNTEAMEAVVEAAVDWWCSRNPATEAALEEAVSAYRKGECYTLPNGECVGDGCVHDEKWALIGEPFRPALPSTQQQEQK